MNRDMEQKKKYIAPEIEIVPIEFESSLMASSSPRFQNKDGIDLLESEESSSSAPWLSLGNDPESLVSTKG